MNILGSSSAKSSVIHHLSYRMRELFVQDIASISAKIGYWMDSDLSSCTDDTFMYHRFVDEMPDARLVWVEQCGHVPHLEQPDDAARAIMDFVENGNPAKVLQLPSEGVPQNRLLTSSPLRAVVVAVSAVLVEPRQSETFDSCTNTCTDVRKKTRTLTFQFF